MTLRTRPLGTSGLQITQVGFGAWAIGGGGWAYGWGSQDDAASIAAIKHAVASGINWVDTAAIYGLGHSEEVVGRALREIPAAERPFVFTKGGQVADPSKPFAEPQRNLRPGSIRKEVEASLRRLGVDRIDLYQFHWPDAIGTPIEDSWGEMARLIEEGKVRAGGVSNFDVGPPLSTARCNPASSPTASAASGSSGWRPMTGAAAMRNSRSPCSAATSRFATRFCRPRHDTAFRSRRLRLPGR